MIKKKMGQNFLKDKSIIDSFINFINPKKDENFIEIGAGLGYLSKKFIDLDINKIFLIEIDSKLYYILINKFLNNKKFIILNKDARNLDFNIFKKYTLPKYRIFGSLPYFSSIPIIINLFKYINYIIDIHFIIQKEVAEKLVSVKGSNKYSKISIISNLFFETNILYKNINPESFYPKPKVHSSIIKMYPNLNKLSLFKNEDDFLKFNKILKISFENKRKKIKNNLLKIFNINQLKSIEDINLSDRAQDLSIEQYYKLSKIL